MGCPVRPLIINEDMKTSQGWRFAFYVVAVLAAVTAVVNLVIGVDPRVPMPQSGGGGGRRWWQACLDEAWRACRELGRSLRAVLRIRTFQVLVLQVDATHVMFSCHS